MVSQNEMKQLLKNMPEEDLRFIDQLLVVKLGSSGLVESAALVAPANGACESLCMSCTMGMEDIEGMEDDTTVRQPGPITPNVSVLIIPQNRKGPSAGLCAPADGPFCSCRLPASEHYDPPSKRCV